VRSVSDNVARSAEHDNPTAQGGVQTAECDRQRSADAKVQRSGGTEVQSTNDQ
jgi:hypothetical protein